MKTVICVDCKVPANDRVLGERTYSKFRIPYTSKYITLCQDCEKLRVSQRKLYQKDKKGEK